MTGPVYNVGPPGRYPQQYPPHERPPVESPTSTLFSEQKVTTIDEGPSGARRFFAYFSAFLFFATAVVLIAIQIGNTSNHHALSEIYFFKMDLSHIVADGRQIKLPAGKDVATVAGLHDFYQVGMWNFCEGNYPQGITACSKPKMLFWFNPIETLNAELNKGNSSKLIISLSKLISHCNFC